MLSKKQKAARDLFSEGKNCAQAVLSVFCDRTGLTEETALALTACMGGGMWCGAVCGAVTGALMVLGMDDEGHPVSKAIADAKAKAFHARFRALHDAIICDDLLHDVFSDPEGLRRLGKRGAFTTDCPHFVTDAVAIVEQLLEEDAG